MYKLYDLALSGHCHKVRLFLNILGQDYETVPVDLLAGEQHSEAYLRLNPFGTVPVLVDGSTVIRDSNAILVYLALKHQAEAARDWYPRDAQTAAEVQQWFNISANQVLHGPAKAYIATVFTGDTNEHVLAVKNSHKLYAIMDPLLAGRAWLVGGQPTLADIANYSYISRAPIAGVDLSPYDNIRRWLKNVENLDGFLAMPLPDPTPARDER